MGAVGATAAPPDVLPGIIGPDDRTILDSQAWPWAAIGRINRAGRGFCTGTLVAPDVVITAAHCLYDPQTRRKVPAGELHFLPGYRRGEAIAHAVARTVLEGDGYQFAARPPVAAIGSDWALLLLAGPLSILPVPVGPLDGTAEERLVRAGYSQNRPHMLSVHDGCEARGHLADGRILLHTCDATRGDSGSPLLVRDSQGYRMVGIAVGAIDTPKAPIGVGVDARVFARSLQQAALLRKP